MEKSKDSYRTIGRPSEVVLFKDRKSKFYGYAYPVSDASEVKALVEGLRKTYPAANHVCYAWQTGVANVRYRINDDGEPNNSAGMPIYGQIQSYELTNILIAVVRVFGGTKLGVGGLINAYKTAAQMTLEASTVVEKTLKTTFLLRVPYTEIDKVMRIVKRRRLQIISQKMELECTLGILVRQAEADSLQEVFENLQNISVKRVE